MYSKASTYLGVRFLIKDNLPSTDTIVAKDEFIKELRELENIRNVDHNTYEKYLRDRKRRAMS